LIFTYKYLDGDNSKFEAFFFFQILVIFEVMIQNWIVNNSKCVIYLEMSTLNYNVQKTFFIKIFTDFHNVSAKCRTSKFSNLLMFAVFVSNKTFNFQYELNNTLFFIIVLTFWESVHTIFVYSRYTSYSVMFVRQ